MCPSKWLWSPLVLNASDAKRVLTEGRSSLLLPSFLLSTGGEAASGKRVIPDTREKLTFFLVSENFALFFLKKNNNKKKN